jgi:hypothetical protein
MVTPSPQINKATFIEILSDKNLIKPDDLLIFQTLYSLEKQEASATDLARIIGWKDKNSVVSKVVGLGKRILKKYNFQPREREDGSNAYWDFFFSGYYQGTFFIYQLKSELKEALEEFGMVENIQPISLQNAYLFVWNPKHWSQWTDPGHEPNIERNPKESSISLFRRDRTFIFPNVLFQLSSSSFDGPNLEDHCDGVLHFKPSHPIKLIIWFASEDAFDNTLVI